MEVGQAPASTAYAPQAGFAAAGHLRGRRPTPTSAAYLRTAVTSASMLFFASPKSMRVPSSVNSGLSMPA